MRGNRGQEFVPGGDATDGNPFDAFDVQVRRMLARGGDMPKQKKRDDAPVVVPIPSSDTQAEHDRVRQSNDRDQRLEREGKPAPHNRGYDEAADGPPSPKVRHIVDEP
jgi:hypothetical protein